MSGADKGVELHQFLAAKGVEGIVNGMDVEEWDPAVGGWVPRGGHRSEGFHHWVHFDASQTHIP